MKHDQDAYYPENQPQTEGGYEGAGYGDQYQNYDSYDNYYTDPYGEDPKSDKTMKGLKIMILVLAIILVGLSTMYFLQVRQMQADYREDRDTLTSQLTSLLGEYDSLSTENDTISQHLLEERSKADSLLQLMQKERNLSRSKIRDYEKRLGYMRDVMEGYIRQIDSLNTVNKQLVTENTTIRKQITSARLRADMAEEQAAELSIQVEKGSVIRAREINLIALSRSDREVTRASRAERMRVDFVLVGNELTRPGARNVYAQIMGPDGYVMSGGGSALFNYEGDMITYSATREVDYQNEDLYVSLYYNGTGITAGTYQVRVFVDGHLIGSNEVILR